MLEQAHVIKQHSDVDMVVASGGRCDYSGKCAKFCTYMIMEISSNIIIHSETVEKRGKKQFKQHGERRRIPSTDIRI